MFDSKQSHPQDQWPNSGAWPIDQDRERGKILGALVDCIQMRVEGKQKKRDGQFQLSAQWPHSALRLHNGMQVAQMASPLCSIIQQTTDNGRDCHRQAPSYWTNMAAAKGRAVCEVAKRPFPTPNLPNNINGSLSGRLGPKNAHTGQGNSGQALLWDRRNNALSVNPSNLSLPFGLKGK